jgi:hypothetical protein
LPPLPDELAQVIHVPDFVGAEKVAIDRLLFARRGPARAAAAAPPATTVDPRAELFQKNPELLMQLGEALTPVLMKTHIGTVNASIRLQCLTAICKIILHSPAPVLVHLLRVCFVL